MFPTERRVVKALKPILTKAAGVPMPHDTVFDANANELHVVYYDTAAKAVKSGISAIGAKP